MTPTQTYSDYGSDELDEELVQLQERREEVVKVVDEKTFDMRTIVILSKTLSTPPRSSASTKEPYLIRHQHETTIPQPIHAGICFVVLQAQNLLDILDLLVLHDLVVLRVPDIE